MFWNSFTGLMARRLLVNWRVPLDVAASVLPAGGPTLRPKAVGGWAIAGLCLVRLEQLRPVALPAACGLSSENLAVRMGIEWDTATGPRNAVIIFRRETASAMNGIVAERIGYGVHQRSSFRVFDDRRTADIAVRGLRDAHHAHVRVGASARISRNSVFQSIAQAESYFRGSECGYSPARLPGVWQGARLHMHRSELEAMNVEVARSSYLEMLFRGAAQIDSAFVMRDIRHMWSPCGAEHFGILAAQPVISRQACAA